MFGEGVAWSVCTAVDLSAFWTVDLWVLTKCRHYEGVGLMYQQSSSWELVWVLKVKVTAAFILIGYISCAKVYMAQARWQTCLVQETQTGYLYFVWAVVFKSDGVSLTLAWCGKTRHGSRFEFKGPENVVCHACQCAWTRSGPARPRVLPLAGASESRPPTTHSPPWLYSGLYIVAYLPPSPNQPSSPTGHLCLCKCLHTACYECGFQKKTSSPHRSRPYHWQPDIPARPC